MVQDVPLDTAGIVSTVIEGVLYGFSVLMYGLTIWVSYRQHSGGGINRKMVVLATLLLVFSTTHIVIDVVRIQEGLVKRRDTFPGGPPAFFADVAQTTFVSKNAVYTLQTLLGDAVVIYRCYVVWQTFWIIILPVMLWCSVAASAVGSVYAVSQATENSSNIFFRSTGEWVTAFFASTLTTNLLSTGLLAYRIWSIDRELAEICFSSRPILLPVVRVVLDAGILYSVTLLSALICFVCKSNAQYIVLDTIIPIISIAFYMIIIRVAMARDRIHSPQNMSSALRTTTTTRGYSREHYRVPTIDTHGFTGKPSVRGEEEEDPSMYEAAKSFGDTERGT